MRAGGATGKVKKVRNYSQHGYVSQQGRSLGGVWSYSEGKLSKNGRGGKQRGMGPGGNSGSQRRYEKENAGVPVRSRVGQSGPQGEVWGEGGKIKTKLSHRVSLKPTMSQDPPLTVGDVPSPDMRPRKKLKLSEIKTKSTKLSGGELNI